MIYLINDNKNIFDAEKRYDTKTSVSTTYLANSII